MTVQLWILEKLSNFILEMDGLYGICIISQWCCYQKKEKSIHRMVNEWVNGGHFELVFKNTWARVVIEAPCHPAFLIPHTPSQAPTSLLATPGCLFPLDPHSHSVSPLLSCLDFLFLLHSQPAPSGSFCNTMKDMGPSWGNWNLRTQRDPGHILLHEYGFTNKEMETQMGQGCLLPNLIHVFCSPA